MVKPQCCGAPFRFLFSTLIFTLGWKFQVPACVTAGVELVPLAVLGVGLDEQQNQRTVGFSFYLTLTS